ncbi:MAG: DNA cytosine methyltransferase [Bacilli bacterium]|jgi:DNA (cytosine-5)-methyltransferase 1|nr:DNA cytosine methyltransferase [Bacilli bacterium]MCH4235449.1 DNA cytosine methyltransferase [Bacilli bacterium]
MLRLATLFSGIGAIEHALYRMNIKHKIVFACDNGDVDVLSNKINYDSDSIWEALEDLSSQIAKQKPNIFKSKNDDIPWQFDFLVSQHKKVVKRYKELSSQSLIDEKNEKKQIKELADQTSMLYERLNTIKVLLHLETLKTYEEKKQYVDSLYEKKKSANKVMQSYMANYDLSEKDYHWNISFLDGKQYKDKVDMLVGGSPCQSFSLVGKQRGLADTRGTLFYEFARMIKQVSPKIFIYENVRAVLSNDNGKTWATMQKVFTELNYSWSMQVLNAKDFGIPQNRERIFVVGFRNDLKLKNQFEFPKPIKLERKMSDFLVDNPAGHYYLPEKGAAFVTDKKNLNKSYTQIDGIIALCQTKNQQFNWHGDFIFVENDPNKEKTMTEVKKYYLSQKVQAYVMADGTKGFHSKPATDLDVARPLLQTMHKMHRSGIDNYVTREGHLRKLTPRECLRLMGFSDTFKIVVADTPMYQQAGNSIVVDVLIALVKQIKKSYDFGGDSK